MTWEDTMNVMLPSIGTATAGTTSSFGVTRNKDGKQVQHKGTDFNYRDSNGNRSAENDKYPTVYAPIDGEVVKVGGKYNEVHIKDKFGNTHEILHLDTTSVTEGQKIKAGDKIGTMGGYGPKGKNEFKTHIHYQMKDAAKKTINPEAWWDNEDNRKNNDALTKQPTNPVTEDTKSPLVLDLDDDDITSTWVYDDYQIHFDLDGDGFRERVGWIEAGDGLLALDLDQSGTIDSGKELFGNYTPDEAGVNAENGFLALARYDNNEDGIIDANDAIYTSLVVWADANSDGVSQSNELFSLNALGITSINLDATETNLFENANTISHTSTFTRMFEDGSTAELSIRDVWFQQDAEDTHYDFTGTISAEVAALPAMAASGRVISLTHAMAGDAALQASVESLLSNSNAPLSSLLSMADTILAKWAGVENISPTATRGEHWFLNHNYANPQESRVYRVYAYARDIAILEKFSGDLFMMSVDGEATEDVHGTLMAQHKKVEYQALRTQVALTLLSQSLLGADVYDEATDSLNFDEIYTRLDPLLQAASPEAISLLAVLIESNRMSVFNHLDVSLLSNPAIRAGLQASGIVLSVDAEGNVSGRVDDAVYAPGTGGTLNGTNGDDVLHGSDAADILRGSNGHDTLFGNDGDDIMYYDVGGTLDISADTDHTDFMVRTFEDQRIEIIITEELFELDELLVFSA